jgi:hypothetical protein
LRSGRENDSRRTVLRCSRFVGTFQCGGSRSNWFTHTGFRDDDFRRDNSGRADYSRNLLTADVDVRAINVRFA